MEQSKKILKLDLIMHLIIFFFQMRSLIESIFKRDLDCLSTLLVEIIKGVEMMIGDTYMIFLLGSSHKLRKQFFGLF